MSAAAVDPAYKALVVAADAAADALRLYYTDPVSFTDLAVTAAENFKIAYATYNAHIAYKESKANEPEAKRRC
jgi:hypothetical protein